MNEKKSKSNKVTARDSLPSVLLDHEGYPTEEWLQYLRTYKPDKSLALFTFIKEVLPEGWYMSDWGFVLRRRYNRINKLELHTGGWSGNEEVIDAILSNMQFTHFQMRYVMWRAGGHYYFEINNQSLVKTSLKKV